MSTQYKIIDFDEAAAQVTIRVSDLAPIVVDLPIDDAGNLPTGEALALYLTGFVPTWHFERQQKLANGVSNASAIAALVEPEPIEQPTSEQLAAQARSRRDTLLSASDWTQTLDAPLTQLERAAWASYRQGLRDVPAQSGFPESVVWPASPDSEPR